LAAGLAESVNPVAGNLTLSFPMAALPPGPGGFSTGVNLLYNSAFLTSNVDFNGTQGTQLRILYQNQSSGGWNTGTMVTGGWSYGFRYTLWSATEPTYATAGNSMYLATPDGANHLLLLVGALNSSGAAISPSFHQNYPDQAVYDIDFTGYCVNSSNSACVSNRFNGTLIFASADSTFIRVESNTVTKTWIAYFADGTKVTGNFNPTTAGGTIGEILAAESNTIEDKNGNTLNIDHFCIDATPCTTTIKDQYQRVIDINYGAENNSFPTTWTDTISQPGVNGSVIARVRWERYVFTGPSYDCIYSGSGSALGTCDYSLGVVTPFVVTSVQLPSATGDGATTIGPSTVYVFNYAPPSGSLNWGELHTMSKKVLTSGKDVSACLQTSSTSCSKQSQVDYSYYFDNASHHRVMGTLVNPVSSRVLTYQEVRDGTSTSLSESTSYSIPVPTSFDPAVPAPVGGTSTITGPDGSQTVIYTGASPDCTNAKSGLCPAVIYKVVNPDGTQSETAWVSGAAPPGAPSGGFVNPYPRYSIQTIGSKAKGSSTTRDSNGNALSVSEYDWFSASSISRQSNVIAGIPGSAARTMSSTYYTAATAPEYWNHTAPRYLRAIQTASLGAASTSYTYDDALTTANLTQQSWWDSVTGGNISRSWSYTDSGVSLKGNVVTATDPNGIITKTTYDGNKLYPTGIAVALDRPEQRTTSFTYDTNSGLLTSSGDDNGVTVANLYDNLGRLTQTTQSGGGGLSRSTSTQYDDLEAKVTTTQNQVPLSTTTYYDPLGRVRLTVDAAGNKVQKAYRFGSSGLSYQLESNPYTTIDATTGWTLTTRDASTSNVTAQTYKGVDPPAPWVSGSSAEATGTVTATAYDQTMTNCSGPTANVTDQANRTTKYCRDGLGRMVAVTDAASNVTQQTYDLMDNLTRVTQAGQTRAFEYSTLGRLTKACNPETGSAACSASSLPDTGLEKYTYDAVGNLLTKTDAKSVTTTWAGYDGLNRPHTKSYTKSDGTAEGTPTVTYVYDQHSKKGTLSSVSTTVGTSALSTEYTYDGFGRIASSTQTTGAAAGYGFVYTYTLTDQLQKIQYPSGRIVNYVTDSAGRVSAVKNDVASTYYVQSIGYTPAGGVSTMTLGNNVIEQRSWNDRLQLTGLAIGKQGETAKLTLGFFPCSGSATSCASGNTGNIQTQTISLPGLSQTQNYTNDSLDRILTAGEGTGSWMRTFGYDAVGNQHVDPAAANTYGYPTSSFTPTASSNFDAANRLFVNSAAYDSSGSQSAIGGYSFTSDAEGRITSANLVANNLDISSTGYVYDGDGLRVQKVSCPAGTRPCLASTAGAVITTYVYDAFGHLAAEYGGSTGTQAGCGTPTCYLSVDQIGSTRLVTDAAGNVVRRYDYLPFGEELWAGVGGRTTAMGYQSAADGFNPKFTGQMRDPESQLDYFNARYYSPAQGRFVSPDPENAGADIGTPQTWNGYAYVSNNPLVLTDPGGRQMVWAISGGATGTPIGVAIGGIVDLAIAFYLFAFDSPAQPTYTRMAVNWNSPVQAAQIDYAAQMAAAFSGMVVTTAVFRVDVTREKAVAPNNGRPKPTLIKVTIPGTNYCGPGGSGTPTNQVDAACAAHDLCYQNAGVSFVNNLGWPKTAQQTAAIQACDANLCSRLSSMSWPSSSEPGQATLVSTFFGCSGGYSLR
jgi:RHS repeat-associated protein